MLFQSSLLKMLKTVIADLQFAGNAAKTVPLLCVVVVISVGGNKEALQQFFPIINRYFAQLSACSLHIRQNVSCGTLLQLLNNSLPVFLAQRARYHLKFSIRNTPVSLKHKHKEIDQGRKQRLAFVTLGIMIQHLLSSRHGLGDRVEQLATRTRKKRSVFHAMINVGGIRKQLDYRPGVWAR